MVNAWRHIGAVTGATALWLLWLHAAVADQLGRAVMVCPTVLQARGPAARPVGLPAHTRLSGCSSSASCRILHAAPAWILHAAPARSCMQILNTSTPARKTHTRRTQDASKQVRKHAHTHAAPPYLRRAGGASVPPLAVLVLVADWQPHTRPCPESSLAHKT